MKKFKIILPVLLTFIFLFLLTGCAEKLNSEDKAEIVNNTVYPLSYTDGYGDTSIIEKEPARVVSLTPNITEVLCSLGLESKLVGRTNYCDYPASVLSIESVGELATPNLEKIIELNPDVIITDGMQTKEFVTNLRDLGIKVICLRQNQTLEGTYQILTDAGLITNKNKEAKEIMASMKSELTKIEEKIKNVEKKTVFYAVDFGDYGLYTAGKGTYIDELFVKAGLINIASDSEGWTYSLEKLYENNPDIMICSKFYGTKERLMSYEAFKDLDAVKNSSVVEIDNNQLDRQTARNIEAIKELVHAIYNIQI